MTQELAIELAMAMANERFLGNKVTFHTVVYYPRPTFSTNGPVWVIGIKVFIPNFGEDLRMVSVEEHSGNVTLEG